MAHSFGHPSSGTVHVMVMDPLVEGVASCDIAVVDVAVEIVVHPIRSGPQYYLGHFVSLRIMVTLTLGIVKLRCRLMMILPVLGWMAHSLVVLCLLHLLLQRQLQRLRMEDGSYSEVPLHFLLLSVLALHLVI